MIKKTHYFSGFIILIFIISHLINHLLSLIDVNEHIVFMTKLRNFYYNPFIELPLILQFFTQVISGLVLVFRLRKRNKDLIIWEKWQVASGIYLALFIIIHISAVLIGRHILKLDTNIYFAMAGLNTFPHYFFFVPYYFLAILSLFIHIAAIHYSKTRVIFGVSKKFQSIIIILIGVIVSSLIITGMTDGLKGRQFPVKYKVLVGK